MINEKKPQKIIVDTHTVVGSQHSQLIGVSVTDIDITLEFVYINPRDNTKGQVVSRITLPLNVGIDLANTILMTTKIHENKKKGEQHA